MLHEAFLQANVRRRLPPAAFGGGSFCINGVWRHVRSFGNSGKRRKGAGFPRNMEQ